MEKKYLISVVVATYNRPDALIEVLHGLMNQTDSHFEIVIADDGSGPVTRDAIDAIRRQYKQRCQVRLIHTWHPDDGFRASAARNMGVAASRGEYLIFLDGDCVPRVDFITQHRRLAEPGCLVSGSRVLISEVLTRSLLASSDECHIYERSGSFWLMQRVSGNINKILPLIVFPDNRFRHYRSVKWKRIKSCNLAVWRTDYMLVNGFDESFIGWGHEDADLVLRLARAGVTRKGGAFSTEVFHLWHREYARTSESENHKRVEERVKSGLIKAPQGLCGHPFPQEEHKDA